MRRLAIVLLCAALAAGCGDSVAGQPDSLKASASPTYAPITPAEACPAGQAQHLPASYAELPPAYVCKDDTKRVPGDGLWSVRQAYGVTGGLEQVISAFKGPNQTTPPHVICALVLIPLPVIYLHGERLVVASAPSGPCSGPTAAAGTAFNALELTLVGETRVSRIQGELSVASGCPEKYKDMLAIEQETGGPRSSNAKPAALAGESRICRYAAADEEGQLTSASTPSPAELTRLNDALAQSVRDSSCSRVGHKEFALVWSPPNGGSTLVALDGCAVQQDGGWWRATDQLRELLAAS